MSSFRRDALSPHRGWGLLGACALLALLPAAPGLPQEKDSDVSLGLPALPGRAVNSYNVQQRLEVALKRLVFRDLRHSVDVQGSLVASTEWEQRFINEMAPHQAVKRLKFCLFG
jgi:hypothetical protein